MIHTTHCGTNIQISDECFPKQFLHPANGSNILLGKIQETSKDLKAKLHNWEGASKWINIWSTSSPLHRHVQHQSTIVKPLFLKW